MSDDWQRAREESKLGEYDDVLDADERRTAAEERGLPAESEEPDQTERSQDLAEAFDFSVRVF
eukprot:2397979-Rhodomonas_salina.3